MKKLVALILVGILTTGMGVFGTFSAFSGSSTFSDKVNITLGTLVVNATQAAYGGVWRASNGIIHTDTIDTKSQAINPTGDQTLTFENAKPGDVFVKTVLVNNYGSLNANTLIKLAPQPANSPFDVTISPSVNYAHVTIAGNQTDGFTMVLPTNEHSQDWGQGVLFEIKVTIKDGGNDWQGLNINLGTQKFIDVTYSQLN
jgi:hypothetical protein